VAIGYARSQVAAPLARIAVDPARARDGRTSYAVPTDGVVVGTLLNYRGALAALGDEVRAKPYLAPPVAPILYLKPANTWLADGTPIPLPAGVAELEAGAALGIVIGRTAARVRVADALSHVLGYTIVNDVCEPHASVYRPAIRQRCRDGFCPIGPWIVARDEVGAPDALALRVFVNGECRANNTTANLIRPVARLIADVTAFMTLAEGDVLLAGVPEGMPRIRAGDRVRIEIDRIGALENPVAAGEPA